MDKIHSFNNKRTDNQHQIKHLIKTIWPHKRKHLHKTVLGKLDDTELYIIYTAKDTTS